MNEEGIDLVGQLLATARQRADQPALSLVGGKTLSYAEFAQRVMAVACRLRQQGFGPGQRMLFSIRPSPTAAIVVVGAIAAGGSIAFIDPGMGEELFEARRKQVSPTWAAAESILYAASSPGPLRAVARRRGLLLPRFAQLPVRHLHSGYWLPGTPLSSTSVKQLMRPLPEGSLASGELDLDSPELEALVVFTSGTTSDPKAVVHTRGSLGAAFQAMFSRSKLEAGAHLYTDQLMIGLPALVGGAHWSMPKYSFASHVEPAQLAKELDGATHTFIVPADLPAILKSIEAGEAQAPKTLRQIMLGGAPVTTTLLRRTAAVLPDVECIAIYGMTEILPVAMTSGALKLAHEGDGDPLGQPLPGVNARVEEDGELVLSGPNMCSGYLGSEPMTEHHSGDLARIDESGITLIGRKKDMIIRGKTNVYPGLYEPLIAGIEGVAQAVLVGLPDEIGDERIVLALVPSPGADGNLIEHVRSRLPQLIDASALPDRIELVSEIPVRGRTRKPDRAALRSLLS